MSTLPTDTQENKPRRSSRRSRSVQSEDSASSLRYEVRCACQFFQSEEILPDYRKNPVGSAPTIHSTPNRMSPIIFNHNRAISNESLGWVLRILSDFCPRKLMFFFCIFF